MHIKSSLTNYGIVAGAVIGMALSTVLPAAAQQLPNRLQGPVRINEAPTARQETQTINKQGPAQRAPEPKVRDGGGSRQVVVPSAHPRAPVVPQPTPSTQTSIPTQRTSNAGLPDTQSNGAVRVEKPPVDERQAEPPNDSIGRLAPVVVQPTPNTNARTTAQSTPNTEVSPGQSEASQLVDRREAELRKERFRRRAAEAAQKQIEQMADQLREQLGREVTARQTAEAVATELLSRASLEDQIDQERKRLRNEKVDILERMVEALSKRLTDERGRRQQLEEENAKLVKASAAGTDAAPKTKLSALRSRIKALERELAAAQWARKLAEAQLKVLTDKTDNR